MLFNAASLFVLLQGALAANIGGIPTQNKVIFNDITTATLTVTPGQPVETPSIAAPSYSRKQTTVTSVYTEDGTTVTKTSTLNPIIEQKITQWVTVTASGASDASDASSSAEPTSETSSDAAPSSTASQTIATTDASSSASSSHSYSTTSYVTYSSVKVVTVPVVSTIYA